MSAEDLYTALDSTPLVRKKLISASSLDLKDQLNRPVADQIACIRYKARLSNGVPYDECWLDSSSPHEFRIMGSTIIKGVSHAVLSMVKGEHADFMIEGDLAFGPEGTKEIPPNETVFFEIILEDFRCEAKNKLELSKEERIAKGIELKDAANKFLEQGALKEAVENYKDALNYVDWESGPEVQALRIVLHNNLALAFTRQRQFDKAILEAHKGLQFDKTNPKGYYRAGKAARLGKEFSQARDYFRKGLEVDPKNKEIQAELEQVDVDERLYNEEQKRIFGKVLQQDGFARK